MAIFHFKHSYLNWRVFPCRREMICVYAFFSAFFRFMFGLKRISQVHNMTINFSFSFIHSFFFFFFVNCLFWATSHVVDGFPAWNISSHVRIVLKWLVFGSLLLVSFLFRGKIWLKSILEKWAVFGQWALRYQSRWFQSVMILGLVFLFIEKVWQVWSKSWCISNYQLLVFFKNSSFFVVWFSKNSRRSF